jgi:type II secretion system protein N
MTTTAQLPPQRRLAKAGGYAAFSFLALVIGFFLTFPYDALRERARLEAEASGYFLRVGSLGPGFFTVRASEVAVSKRADTDPPPEALKVDSVSFGPSLWPPGARVTMRALGGTVAVASPA